VGEALQRKCIIFTSFILEHQIVISLSNFAPGGINSVHGMCVYMNLFVQLAVTATGCIVK